MTSKQKVAETGPEWECGWKENELAQARHFRLLSIEEKYQAVEDMCEVVEFFNKQTKLRRENRN